jgi:hypothetical protein
VVAKDNTVTMAHQVWQIGKTQLRSTLAGCTVTIHEHLDGRVSIRYGPHVVGRYDAEGRTIKGGKHGGKDGAVETLENQTQVSHRSHSSLEISPTPRDSHFPAVPAAAMTIARMPRPKKNIDLGRAKAEIQKQDSRFHTAPAAGARKQKRTDH